MDRSKIRDLTLLFYCVGILLFIWGNSAVPADASSADSGNVQAWILSVFPFLSEIPFLLFLANRLRKVMHFTEFFLLGIGTVAFFAHRRRFSAFRFWLMILGGPFVACLDEGIQLFTEGRVASIIDIGIDTLGYFSCIVLYAVAVFFVRVIRRKGEVR